MPTISEANNMQIRPPMDVMITLQVGDDVPLTYSGYSSAKVADGRLNEPNRKMMPLTDLQGDGYPLDYTCILYDPEYHLPNHEKWGVRSNIGEPCSVTITSTASIGYVSAWADGCESVTYNGNTYELVAGSVNLYVEDTTATITFNPLYEDRRVEVSLLASGSYYIFNNDSIISCVVSLRSDLSIINPTLPESEIELQIFQDEDISERLASIPDETLITYTAGYPDEMSQVRNFYLAEKITWSDNVMTIRAVDAVHKLDVQLPTATLITSGLYDNPEIDEDGFVTFIKACLRYAGIEHGGELIAEHAPCQGSHVYIPLMSLREAISRIIAWGRFDTIPELRYGFWFNYVDAGIPMLHTDYSDALWDIYEEDCGDVKKDVARNIKEIKMPVTKISLPQSTSTYATEVGTGTWIYGSGVFLDFDDNVAAWTVKDAAGNTILSLRSDRDSTSSAERVKNALNDYDLYGLMQSGLPIGCFNSGWGNFYTQVMPWNSNQLTRWNADIGSSVREDQSVTIFGSKVLEESSIESFSTGEDDGEIVTLDEAPMPGKLIVKNTEASTQSYTLYPNIAAQTILNMSNITGSFKWKGDPRMQPRDSAYFHRVNGVTELITIENITITHEGGGTSAEITYRKGRC